MASRAVLTMASRAVLTVAVLVAAVALGSEASLCRSSVALHQAPGSALLQLRLRGGMAADDDTAKQMAEIRARRAREYEEQKKAHQVEAAEAAAEEQNYVGAQKVWAVVTDKLTAKTIQPKVPMAKGDARSYYLDSSVTLLRNRNSGMVIELLHDSTGWFQFMAREGASLQQMSSTGNVVPAERFYAAGLLEEVKTNPLKTNLISSKGVTGGSWKLGIQGRSLVLTNAHDPTREVHLLEEGFVYISKSSDEGIHIDSAGSPAYMPLPEAQTIITSLAS